MEYALIVLEFVLIFVLQFIGIRFHVLQKISALGDLHPEKSREEIKCIFDKEDWDTLQVSYTVLALTLVIHLVILVYAPSIRTYTWYHLGSFGVSLVLGYGGQRMIYKYLGSAEKFMDRNIESKLK